MADTPEFRIEYAILCDDARIEESRKIMLIGIYGGSILVEKLPAPLNLCVAVGVNSSVTGVFPIFIEILLNGKSLASSKGKINMDVVGEGMFVARGFLVVVDAEGTLEIRVKEPEKNSRTVSTKRVNLKSS